jgi:hypothetical protein
MYQTWKLSSLSRYFRIGCSIGDHQQTDLCSCQLCARILTIYEYIVQFAFGSALFLVADCSQSVVYLHFVDKKLDVEPKITSVLSWSWAVQFYRLYLDEVFILMSGYVRQVDSWVPWEMITWKLLTLCSAHPGHTYILIHMCRINSLFRRFMHFVGNSYSRQRVAFLMGWPLFFENLVYFENFVISIPCKSWKKLYGSWNLERLSVMKQNIVSCEMPVLNRLSCSKMTDDKAY